MNTEKIEKLKKGLNNTQISDSIKAKIREQIARLEKEDLDTSNIVVKDEEEVVFTPSEEIKEENPLAEKFRAKALVSRKSRAKKLVAEVIEKPIKRTVLVIAKEIREEGESWAKARERASKLINKSKEKVEENYKKELEKLLKYISTKKELDGITGKDLRRDAKRNAKQLGRRTVTKSGETSNQYGTFDNKIGKVYYENRDGHGDRLSKSHRKGMPYLEEGGFFDKLEDVKFRFNVGEKIKIPQIGEDNKRHLVDAEIIEQIPAEQSDGTYYPFYWVRGHWEKAGKSIYDEEALLNYKKGIFENGGDFMSGVYADGGEIKTSELNLGYQYRYEIDEDNRGSIYKEHGVFFVNGFDDGKHFRESFEKLPEAKKFYLSKAKKDLGYTKELDKEAIEYITGKKVIKSHRESKDITYKLEGSDYWDRMPIGEVNDAIKNTLKFTISKKENGGSVTNDRRHVNHNEDYEVRYAKGKDRHGYGGIKYHEGGNINEEKTFELDFYAKKSDKEAYYDKVVKAYSVKDVIEKAKRIAKLEEFEYVEFYHKNHFLGSISRDKGYDFVEGTGYDDYIKENETPSTYVNEHGVRVQSKVAPEKKVQLNDWIGKTNSSREAMTYADGGTIFGETINLVPLELVPLSTQLSRFTGDSLASGVYVDENGKDYKVSENAIIVHKESGQKFRVPAKIYDYVDTYNLVKSKSGKEIVVYETKAKVADIIEGKLDFSNKDESIVLDKNKLVLAFEKGYIPSATNADDEYMKIERELNRLYSLYEDNEDNEPIKNEINKEIKYLEDITHRLERKYESGGNLEKPYDVAYKTKSGRGMVAKRIMAKSEEEAKEKLIQQMRASSTFDKVYLAHESFEVGGTIIGFEPELLQGVVDMNYTELVGETPAMSSGEMFAKGGSIDTSRNFHENDYDRLVGDESANYPFYSTKEGNYWQIKKESDDKPVAKWYPSKNILKITKDKDLLNWLKENSYLSSEEGDSFAKGGSIKDIDIKVGQKFKLINGEVIEIKRLFTENMDEPWVEFTRGKNSVETSVKQLRLFINKWKGDSVILAKGGKLNDDYQLFLKLKQELKPTERGVSEAKFDRYTLYEKDGNYEMYRNIDGHDIDVSDSFSKYFAKGGEVDGKKIFNLYELKSESKANYKVLYDLENNIYIYESKPSDNENWILYDAQMSDGNLKKGASHRMSKVIVNIVEFGKFDKGGDVSKRTRRTKEQIAKDNYNKEVDAYKWYVVDLENKKATSGWEYKSDAQDDLKDNHEGDKSFKVVAKATLKTLDIPNPNEAWKYAEGGEVTFKEKSTAIAKKFVGKKVEPKYQKEYGKVYDKKESKEVGDKIAGSIVAKEKRKPTANNTKMQRATAYAKANRKEGQSWRDAMKEAFEKVS